MQKFKEIYYQFENIIFKIANAVMLVLVLVLIASVAAQVTMRYVFNNSPSWSVELTRFALVWMVFVGFSIALRDNQHVKIDLLCEIVPKPLKKLFNIVSGLAIFAFIGIVFYFGTRLTIETVTSLSEAMKISYSWVYVSLPISAAFMLVGFVGRIMRESEAEKI